MHLPLENMQMQIAEVEVIVNAYAIGEIRCLSSKKYI